MTTDQIPVLTLTLDQPQDWLNSNDRDGNWGRRHRLTTYWRGIAATLTRKEWKTRPQLTKARVVATIHKPTRRIFDPGNLAPTVKAAIDGMVGDAKILPGDDFRYLVGPDYRACPGSDGRRIVLEVFDLGGAA